MSGTAQETPEVVCSGAGGVSSDLTWLLHRGAQRVRTALDAVAHREGLAGARDWIVLAAVRGEPGRTQLALAQSLGLDKTTLTALLDRLESRGLLLRRPDPGDRRARIPELTPEGAAVHDRFVSGRDAVEHELLAPFSAAEQRALRDLLTRLATPAGQACEELGGSCM